MGDIGTTTTNPIARKPHACEFCWRRIEVGERYSRVRGQYEREWQNWAAHTICMGICTPDGGEYEVEARDWLDLVLSTRSTEQLDTFLARFSPADGEDPDEGETQTACAERQRERLRGAING
jgi:hypothetical protein